MYKSLYGILSIISYICYLVDSKTYKTKDGKLLLNPIELIDLIIEEKSKTDPVNYRTNLVLNDLQNVMDSDVESITECRDEETLKARKVWSRWSKWGSCSVTCGSGAIARARVCLAGRCAPGEREEQHRPCTRAPCISSDIVVDDLRDLD